MQTKKCLPMLVIARLFKILIVDLKFYARPFLVMTNVFYYRGLAIYRICLRSLCLPWIICDVLIEIMPLILCCTLNNNYYTRNYPCFARNINTVNMYFVLHVTFSCVSVCECAYVLAYYVGMCARIYACVQVCLHVFLCVFEYVFSNYTICVRNM